MLGGSCMVGRDNCCCGASAGRPCSISLIYIWGWDILWLGIGCLTMGCGGHHLVGFVQRVEGRGCMDNQHAQVVEKPSSPGGYLLFNLGVLVRVGDSVVEQCSPFSLACMATSICRNHITQNLQHLYNA